MATRDRVVVNREGADTADGAGSGAEALLFFESPEVAEALSDADAVGFAERPGD